jgi:hypothetical protein
MYSGIFEISEGNFDIGDTTALIEITDDKRVRLTRIDADPAVPKRLMFDLPATEVRAYGSLGTIVIKAAGMKFISNRAPELMTMVRHNRLIRARRHAAASGAREWVRAFKDAGSRTWFLTYAATVWISLGLVVLIFWGAIAAAIAATS